MALTLASDNVEVKHLLVSHLLKLGLNPAMDMNLVRRRNLRALINKQCDGSVAEFGRKYDLDEARLSQMLSDTYRGGKNFGEKAARKLEEKIGLPPLALDVTADTQTTYGRRSGDVIGSVPVKAIDDDVDHPAIARIRKVKLRLSAGIVGFATDPEAEDGNPIFFRRDWLGARGFKPENLIAIRVRGQSMEPGLYEGDTVVINTTDTTPRDGEVFAVNYEGEDVIKRMVRDAGTWWLSSDNPDNRRFPRKECVGDMCLIIGRVIHKQSERI